MSSQAEVNLSWEQDWKFTARDAYGHSVTVEAPMRDGDEFDGFKPTHLMMSALGACTGVDVVSILKKKRQDISGVEIRVSGVQEEEWPKKWTAFNVHYTVRGRGIDSQAVHRAIELSEGKYCSVGATLKGTAAITTSFDIVEDHD